MIEISNVDVYGFDHAIRGARNAMNSWDRSDSYWSYSMSGTNGELTKAHFFMGDNDKDLLRRLRSSGSDHAKCLRMIGVWLDINAPMYWWKEFDTYKVGTTRCSTSTMHKLTAKPFSEQDFSCERITIKRKVFTDGIEILNQLRDLYLKIKDMDIWYELIQFLPSSYNQLSTVFVNYEVIYNMYHARKNHKLAEWRKFCEWAESLPYFEELINESN